MLTPSSLELSIPKNLPKRRCHISRAIFRDKRWSRPRKCDPHPVCTSSCTYESCALQAYQSQPRLRRRVRSRKRPAEKRHASEARQGEDTKRQEVVQDKNSIGEEKNTLPCMPQGPKNKQIGRRRKRRLRATFGSHTTKAQSKDSEILDSPCWPRFSILSLTWV